MAARNDAQYLSDLARTMGDLVIVYNNAQALLNTYNDTGVGADVAVLADDKTSVPFYPVEVAKADMMNAVYTLDAFIALMDAGHRKNASVIANLPLTTS